ncbi:gamma-glutamylcyclotransferase [Thermus composti]|uniref:Gamma-glutamylcyclotransferase family protein n=1 Tax=Thermus composti TaxID=532059 RepID=A0ABV6Q2A7_9DEIN|nr:gamma-glutamylcyclotransferase [Thermus composti]GGN06169.1 gamma-glutamylcyclotransferase [Thermus composti]
MEWVFVYGTLKRGKRNHGLVAGSVRKCLPGFVEGFHLYHLPPGHGRPYAYPGMVPGEGQVWGEALLLPPSLLLLLDELEDEGEEYRRVRVRVKTEEGFLEAWAYVYLGPLEGALFLPGGVWEG